jgi:hypothetical protein
MQLGLHVGDERLEHVLVRCLVHGFSQPVELAKSKDVQRKQA